MARCQMPHISAGRGGGLYVTVRWCPQAVPKTIWKLTAAHTPHARGWLRMIGLTACTTPAARNGICCGKNSTTNTKPDGLHQSRRLHSFSLSPHTHMGETKRIPAPGLAGQGSRQTADQGAA